MSSGADPGSSLLRLKVVLRGAVQGVGFRPFVFRLATELGLSGWVNNSAQGVEIEAEGARDRLESFLTRLRTEGPPASYVQSLESSWLDPACYERFEIRNSEIGGSKSALIMPDLATCPECLSEIFAPENRRHLYPFTNCTNCGPRFSIIKALPYDRANTSMANFTMCGSCQAEYDDPADRRFHAQPNACPECGPRLELWGRGGEVLADDPAGPLAAAAQAIRAGQIVAVKGLGGFHLLADARDDVVVQRLRLRKHREEKPLAVMFPSIAAVRQVCEASIAEEHALNGAEAPILLLRRLPRAAGELVAPGVAPGNPNLGVLLPYTPLHHLLLALIKGPVVATSGNLSDEPICIDELEALERLQKIADVFLVHNRPIVRHIDDSLARFMAGRQIVLRRARGYAPLPIEVRTREIMPARATTAKQGTGEASSESNAALPTVLAVGAHLKNAVALGVGSQVFISQHIGDLATVQAYDAFERVTADLQTLYDSPATQIVADSHPDYLSTRFAHRSGLRCTPVQHHVAHVLSCMSENQVVPPALGVSWDGTGYGLDGTVWGGEFFRVRTDGFERVAHFMPFPLPGGEQAIREPRRAALGVLYRAFGPAAFERPELARLNAFTSTELSRLRAMLARKLNAPLTSSVGRLFDAAASLLGLRQVVAFEGQAAMALEFLACEESSDAAYSMNIEQTQFPMIVDWRPGLEAMLEDIRAGVARAAIATKFHNTLVEGIIQVAHQVGLERVALSGGCFQNRYLTEQSVRRLSQEGFRPYWHQRVPPNDGGICLGQVVAARWWGV